uniref:Cadherin domain-containing protein n=1 Tax=Eptatretus burgeri TaxID=7764 RepID=A0A8C4QLN7_EPTBU
MVPEFLQNEYYASVGEDAPLKTSIVRISAKDKDSKINGQIYYTFQSGNDGNGDFEVDTLSGLIPVLDREEAERYRLVLEARDEGRDPGPQSSTVTVSIVVLDENDNAPQFSEERYRVSVSEDVRIPSTVLTVSATDADKGDNAKLQFSIISGNGARQFSIDPNTGEIQVVSPLDFEIEKDYVLNIRVQDNGRPHRSSKSVVTIKVEDDMPIGHSVHEIHATDLDSGENSRLTYSFANIPPGFPFAINNVTGLITVASELDRELLDCYDATVVVRDHGKRSLNSSAMVSISVRDVNDNEPKFTQDTYNVRLNEDAAVGTSVITVTATDRDLNNIVTYEIISGNTRSRFTRTERLHFTDSTARLQAGTTVLADDPCLGQQAVEQSDTTFVDILLTDVNDNSPEFLQNEYYASVGEDAPLKTSIVRISAKDKDSKINGQIYYTFQSGNDGNGDFEVDTLSGLIRTARRLDRETIWLYNLTAYAEDRGTPPRKTPVKVIVTVSDVNDNPPVFHADEFDIFIEENSPVGSVVAKVTAVDPDEGRNAIINYQIVEGNIPEAFQMDIYSGELTALTDLDYESQSQYTIVVQATSAPQPSHCEHSPYRQERQHPPNRDLIYISLAENVDQLLSTHPNSVFLIRDNFN